MRALVDKNIIIEECSDSMRYKVYLELKLNNPDFLKKQKMGVWTGNTPREVFLYERIGKKLVLPFGCLKRFIFDHINEFEQVKNNTKLLGNNIDYKPNFKLFDYQEKAVEDCFEKKNGILIAPCGSGKTQMGLALASRIGGRTLWLTHTQDLLKQSLERAKTMFNLGKDDYGKITAGVVNCGNVLTFATVQTMVNIDLTKLERFFDCIIVDECHHCSGTPTRITQFYKVMNSLSARYKFGLTATPNRNDGMSLAMYSIIGEKLHEVDKSVVAHRVVPIKVKIRKTGYEPDIDSITDADGTLIYHQLISNICANELRNAFIALDIMQAKGSTLVLSERVAHGETLMKLIKGKRCAYLSSSATKKDKEERAQALRKLNAGELDVVFATYQLAKEGLDCPNLMNLVLASPIKEKNTLQQSIGRVQRVAEGKEFGKVYDYEDEFRLLQSMLSKRKSIYKDAV